mgnify:CR=1 FL=1
MICVPPITISFEGATAVVAGAGTGLGATLAGRFASAGANVVVVARSDASLKAGEEAVRAVGGSVLSVRADVTSPADAERVADAAMSRFGRVDVLVNNAFGASAKRMLLDMNPGTLEEWRRTVEVGGYGALVMSWALAPHMVARQSGAIVNITSMSSRIGFAGRSDYAAGKAQAHKIAHALADELGPHGVRVNCVAPGHIWSEQLERFYAAQAAERGVDPAAVREEYTREMALRRIVTEDEVANAVLFLASDLASGITGALLDVNAGHLFTP